MKIYLTVALVIIVGITLFFTINDNELDTPVDNGTTNGSESPYQAKEVTGAKKDEPASDTSNQTGDITSDRSIIITLIPEEGEETATNILTSAGIKFKWTGSSNWPPSNHYLYNIIDISESNLRALVKDLEKNENVVEVYIEGVDELPLLFAD